MDKLTIENLPREVQAVREDLRQIKEMLLNRANEEKNMTSTAAGYITRKAVCEMLHITFPTLHAWIKSGKLKAYHVGGRTLFKESEVLAQVKPADSIN